MFACLVRVQYKEHIGDPEWLPRKGIQLFHEDSEGRVITLPNLSTKPPPVHIGQDFEFKVIPPFQLCTRWFFFSLHMSHCMTYRCTHPLQFVITHVLCWRLVSSSTLQKDTLASLRVCQSWYHDIADSPHVDSEGKDASKRKIAAIQEDINYIESFPGIVNAKEELEGEYFPQYRYELREKCQPDVIF